MSHPDPQPPTPTPTPTPSHPLPLPHPPLSTRPHASPTTSATALISAILSRDAPATTTLLRSWPNLVNIPHPPYSLSALHFSTAHYHHEILHAVLSAHADVDLPSAAGTTALHIAASLPDADAARMLVAAGADVNAADENGNTALHFAAAGGRVEVVGVLLEVGEVEVAAVDSRGNTAVHFAVAAAAVGVLVMLFEKGAGENGGAERKNHCGVTPMMVARRGGEVKGVVQVLKRYGAH